MTPRGVHPLNTQATTQGATAPVQKTFRILYADDVRELRHLMALLLGHDGHTVETVPDGQQALDRISADPLAFDVLITDHHMPVLNGLDLVRALRALPFPGRIVVFTSELDENVTAAYRQLQVQSILPKPVIPRQLREVLAAL